MSMMPPGPDHNPRSRPTTVDLLTPADFGLWVHVPEADIAGRNAGYLYGIHDEFNDGYPSRTLTVVSDNGDATDLRFTDSDPSGYPKTMHTACAVELAD